MAWISGKSTDRPEPGRTSGDEAELSGQSRDTPIHVDRARQGVPGPAPGKGGKARWKEDRGRQAEQASEAEETRPLLSSQAVQDCSSAHSTPHSGLARGRWGTDGWLTDPEGRCLRNLGPSAGGCSFIGRLCPVTWTRPSRLTSISGPRRTWCSCGAIRLASMLMQSVNLIGHPVSMPARIAADTPGTSNLSPWPDSLVVSLHPVIVLLRQSCRDRTWPAADLLLLRASVQAACSAWCDRE